MNNRISVYPDAMGFPEGEQCFPGTSVPVHTLMDYLDAGDSLNGFLDDFPGVTREQAVLALRQARERLLAQGHPV